MLPSILLIQISVICCCVFLRRGPVGAANMLAFGLTVCQCWWQLLLSCRWSECKWDNWQADWKAFFTPRCSKEKNKQLFLQQPNMAATYYYFHYQSVGYFSIHPLFYSICKMPELLPITISQRCHLESDCYVQTTLQHPEIRFNSQ